MTVLSLVATILTLPLLLVAQDAYCPGSIDVGGYGPVQLVPHGWFNHSKAFKPVDVVGGAVVPHMGSRAYFANACTAGAYDQSQYVALHLLGRTFSYTVDLSGATCGCNAALYLASMRQNPKPSWGGDHYCDANKVGGVACTEIDIQEANQFAWHSTCHSSTDKNGKGGGFGGYGGRDWTAQQYGLGARCVDTARPFEVSVSFPVDSAGSLAAVKTVLSQDGRNCPLSVRLEDYEYMAELSAALAAGMTPVVSYWSAEDMLWLDGKGNSNGTCRKDNKKLCSDTVKFYGFSVTGGQAAAQEQLTPLLPEQTLMPQQPAMALQQQQHQDPWLEHVKAQQAAEAQIEQQQVAQEQAREEAKIEAQLQVQEAKATAVIVPTLAPLSERQTDQNGNIVSELFKNVFGGFVRRYDFGHQFESHGAGRAVAAAVPAAGLAAVSVVGAAVALVAARRHRLDRAATYDPDDAEGRTLMLQQLVEP